MHADGAGGGHGSRHGRRRPDIASAPSLRAAAEEVEHRWGPMEDVMSPPLRIVAVWIQRMMPSPKQAGEWNNLLAL